jgi:hypothetical protein
MSEPASLVFELVNSSRSEDDLFADLGENSSDALGFEDASYEEKKQAGLSWWAQHAGEIKGLVCKVANENEASSALIKDIVQVVFGLLGAKFGIGVATYAATIAARRVIAGWCEVDDKSAA